MAGSFASRCLPGLPREKSELAASDSAAVALLVIALDNDDSVVAGGVDGPQAVANSAMAKTQAAMLTYLNLGLVSGNPWLIFIPLQHQLDPGQRWAALGERRLPACTTGVPAPVLAPATWEPLYHRSLL